MEIRIDKPTPNGGDYSIAFVTNRNGDDCNQENGTMIYISEYKADGTWICETVGMLNPKNPKYIGT